MKKIHAELKKPLRTLRISDEFELYLKDPKQTTRLVLKVMDFVKQEEVCPMCKKPFNTKRRYEYNKIEYCYECYQLKVKKHREAKKGQKPKPTAFRAMY